MSHFRYWMYISIAVRVWSILSKPKIWHYSLYIYFISSQTRNKSGLGTGFLKKSNTTDITNRAETAYSQRLTSPPVYSGFHVGQSSCVVFCRSLFVFLLFFRVSILCLSLTLRPLIISLVSPNISYREVFNNDLFTYPKGNERLFISCR